MDEDELFNREGLSPQQYLEFTERERPPNITTEPEMTFVSSPGEPGPRGPPAGAKAYALWPRVTPTSSTARSSTADGGSSPAQTAPARTKQTPA